MKKKGLFGCTKYVLYKDYQTIRVPNTYIFDVIVWLKINLRIYIKDISRKNTLSNGTILLDELHPTLPHSQKVPSSCCPSFD